MLLHVNSCVILRLQAEAAVGASHPGIRDADSMVSVLILIRPLSLSLPPPLWHSANHLSLWKILINTYCTSFVFSFLSPPAASVVSSPPPPPPPHNFHALFTLASLLLFPNFLLFCSFVHHFYCKYARSSSQRDKKVV